MTAEITLAKSELKLDLADAGLTVSDFVPERIVPPLVVMTADTPYLVQASIQTEYDLQLQLVCIAANAVNKKATEALDQLIEDVVKALPLYCLFKTVGQPYALQANNAEYLAANISINLQITI
jgi:hypothetical protein